MTFRILTAIITIDRDAHLAKYLYASLLDNFANNILVITRESDKKTIDFWKNRAIVHTIPHYIISSRHNFDKLIEKRRLAMAYAKNNYYDALWFVDSDILPTPGVLWHLAQTNKDICIAPCRAKWAHAPVIGIKHNNTIKLHTINWIDRLKERRECIIGGFGCTLIKRSAFDVKIEYQKLDDGMLSVFGEDIGFFLNCVQHHIKIEYLTNMIQPHLC
jgi:hypothetical protein